MRPTEGLKHLEIMRPIMRRGCFRIIHLAPFGLLVGALLVPAVLQAKLVDVHYREGTTRGFLALRSPDDTTGMGTGTLTETVAGDRVRSTAIFRFKDGSRYEETAEFSQDGQFRLLTYHLLQKGPSFKQPLEMSIDMAEGRVTVRYEDEHGRNKVLTKRMTLPADLANGLVPTLVKNIPATEETTVSMVVATPKPRLVHLVITPRGSETIPFGRTKLEAERYVVHVNIGGAAGIAAKVAGKQPPDTLVWVLRSKPPAFLASRLPIYGGPTCRVELAAPKLPGGASTGQ